jgi:hypothetical protein
MAKQNKKSAPVKQPAAPAAIKPAEIAKAIEDQGPLAVAMSIALFARDLRLDEVFAKFREDPENTKEITDLVRRRYAKAIQNRRLDVKSFVTLTQSMAAALSTAIK